MAGFGKDRRLRASRPTPRTESIAADAGSGTAAELEFQLNEQSAVVNVATQVPVLLSAEDLLSEKVPVPVSSSALEVSSGSVSVESVKE